MRVNPFLPVLFIISLALPLQVHAGSKPVPSIGIVVKRCNCPPKYACCSQAAVGTPAGFFGPGSAQFAGAVGLEGRCSHDCGGCGNDCGGSGSSPDGSIGYLVDGAGGPFEMSMQSTVLYSVAPIQVSINGVDSFFDVFVSISGQGPLPDDPIPGMVTLPAGQTLDVGTSSQVLSSYLDLHCTITFADAITGEAAGAAIEQDLHLALRDAGLPIARVADGTAEGGPIVLGLDGANLQPFTYSSAGDELTVQMYSLFQAAPVSAGARTWGALKTRYR
jgi:hypothetical protein